MEKVENGKNHPSGAKARRFQSALYGTAEAVPFQNLIFTTGCQAWLLRQRRTSCPALFPCLRPLLQPLPNGIRLDVFPQVKRRQPGSKFLVEGVKLYAAPPVVFFEEPQSLAHNFAGRIVKAGVHLGSDELIEFRGERHIHGTNLLRTIFRPITHFVNLWR
jgi:hypothetical protein